MVCDMSFDLETANKKRENLAKQLKAALEEVGNNLVDEGDVITLFYKAQDHMSKVEEALNTLGEYVGKGKDDIDFGGFLHNVGEAVIDAQQDLDDQSKAYLAKTQNQAHVVPSVFRIPKVSASIKFGMRRVKEKGFNIVLSRRKSTDETTLDQSIDFEVLAVPPPPEFLQKLPQLMPQLTFELDLNTRRAVFEDLDQYYATKNITPSLEPLAVKAFRPAVLLGQIDPNNATTYIVLYANDKADKNVGIWHLVRDPKGEEDLKLEEVLRFPRQPRDNENYRVFRDVIIALAERQIQLIGNRI